MTAKPPAKVSAADLQKRNELRDRATAIERAVAELQAEQLRVAGRFEAFREDIENRYQMTGADLISEDGTIERKESP